jgi:hypothetical protein
VVALMRHPTSYGPPRCRKLGTSRNRLTCLIICLPPYCLLVNYKRCMNIDIVLFRSHLKHLLLWPLLSKALASYALPSLSNSSNAECAWICVLSSPQYLRRRPPMTRGMFGGKFGKHCYTESTV